MRVYVGWAAMPNMTMFPCKPKIKKCVPVVLIIAIALCILKLRNVGHGCPTYLLVRYVFTDFQTEIFQQALKYLVGQLSGEYLMTELLSSIQCLQNGILLRV
jgi:hypothetical protein